MQLSRDLWQGIVPTYDAILEHPFLTGLVDGSLDRASFAFYLRQDALYLVQYARALAALGGRAPTGHDAAMFARHATGALEVERALHEALLGELGVDPASTWATAAAPTNVAYTSYLLAVVHTGSYAEGLAAVLPCYWIYWEVGKHLLDRGSPDKRYQRWIGTYGGEDFGAVVREVLDVTDRVGAEVGNWERELMHQHFRLTSRYEWMFWDMAYRQEQWPL
jgi:thiaminase (transcriptional activator TenA)